MKKVIFTLLLLIVAIFVPCYAGLQGTIDSFQCEKEEGKDYFFLVKCEECRRLINESDYDNAERIPATGDETVIVVDGLDDKRSFGIKAPDGYELYDVRDVLGNSVRAMFGSWTSGYVGHTDNIYYLCSVGAIKNTYTFTFKKQAVGILTAGKDEKRHILYYDMSGRRVNNSRRGGIYVIHYSDGTYKKIMVK